MVCRYTFCHENYNNYIIGSFEGASYPLVFTDSRKLNPTLASLQRGTFREECLKNARPSCPPSFVRDHEEFYISRLESPWSCEEEVSSLIKDIPFHIVNVFDGKVLEMDPESGEMVVNTPTGGDSQKWTFVPSCEGGEVSLTNMGSSEVVQSTYNWKNKTFSRDQTFAFNAKRGGLKWEQELKYLKGTKDPWKRFQWEMRRA